MAQQEDLVLWIDRRWKNAIEKHLNETLQAGFRGNCIFWASEYPPEKVKVVVCRTSRAKEQPVYMGCSFAPERGCMGGTSRPCTVAGV